MHEKAERAANTIIGMASGQTRVKRLQQQNKCVYRGNLNEAKSPDFEFFFICFA